MAISIVALTIAVTKDEVARHYSNGLAGFIKHYPNLKNDGHLIGLSFASKNDLYHEAGRLVTRGMPISSVAIVDQIYGLLQHRHWLEVGELEGRPICWLRGDPPANSESWLARCRPVTNFNFLSSERSKNEWGD